jgi:hypothetical protein
MHFDLEQLRATAVGDDAYSVAELALAAGDTAWNPGSTKHAVVGPATLVYEFFPSGIDGHLFDAGSCVIHTHQTRCDRPAVAGTARCAEHTEE